MEHLVSITPMIILVGITLISIILPAYGQITSPCTPSMITSFTPCINFITNSTANVSSPTADCCNSLKNITTSSMDCGCQILTGNVPFQVPINRTLAISLPRSCNMPSVPLQCKASSAPTPSPGPSSLPPTLSPQVSPSATPSVPVTTPPAQSPVSTPPAQSPESDATPLLTPPSTTGSAAPPPESNTTPLLTPPSTTGSAAPPTSSTGIRPVLTPPSTTSSSTTISPSLLMLAFGVVLFKCY